MAQVPFIPPIPPMLINSNNNTPATANVPVIPDPPPEVTGDLGWGSRPHHGGGFPTYSPYTGPGFIPPHLQGSPNPGVNPNLPPTRAPPNINQEYMAYHGMQGPWSAPAHPAPGWGPSRPPYGYYPPPPNSAAPYGQYPPYPPHQGAWPQQQPPHPYPAGPGGWTPMNPPMMHTPAMQHTPGGFGMLNFDPWNAPPPAWAQATGQPPAVPQPRNDLPEYLHKRSDANVADRVDPFMAGPGYGTSLEPFEVALLGLRPRVNPLLEPLPADINSDRPHLKWNMLFKSNDCSRSTDDPYVSWSKGRDEPATFPRVTKMSIISETVPWTVEVKASNEAIGVTCGEVIEALAENFYLLSTGPEYERLDLKGKNAVFAAYNRNRSRDPGVPGGRLKQGMLRLDFLKQDILYGGISSDDRTVLKLLGSMPPCIYVLKCLKQFAVTAQEARDNEARQKAHEEKERADALREEQRRKEESDRLRQSMDQVTLEDATDSDDDRPD